MTENDQSWDFDEATDRYDEWVAGDSPLYARYDGVLQAVVEVAQMCAGKNALDIGTGTGNLALRCLALGARAAGVSRHHNSRETRHRRQHSLPLAPVSTEIINLSPF